MNGMDINGMCFGYTIRGKLTPLITLISELRKITWIRLIILMIAEVGGKWELWVV